MGILCEYQGNIAKHASETDAGNCDAMNKSILSATGDIVGIRNSNDSFESKDTVEYAANRCCSASDADFVIGDVFFVGESNLRIDHVLVRMRHGGVSTAGLKSNFLLNREIVDACVSNEIYTNLLFLIAKLPFKLLELIRKPRLQI